MQDKSTSGGSLEAGAGRLGTFAGVFTPSILTILGLILFLRLGFVVGSSGLRQALVILLIANGISVLTSVSLAAIATNLRVKTGGDYYLISRTLGVGFGAALGMVLFVAQSVSIAFYCLGFAEALKSMLQLSEPWMLQAIAAAAVALLLLLAWIGADFATRFQYVIMAVLLSGIASFLIGGFGQWNSENLAQNWSPEPSLPFWVVFAIFFPAVTGFTQGVSMSGDLRDPGRSLPQGTFWAVGISAAVYVLAAVVFAAGLDRDELTTDGSAMRRLSSVSWLVDAGVISATISSALSSFLGAPRILQSLASDRVFPFLNVFAKGSGAANNPRRGVLLAGAIALGTVALGELNLIAPIVSMFFLLSYGMLNYATYVEAKANSPSFRPRFRYFDRRLSLLGSLACAGCMLALNPVAGLVALGILFGIYYYVKHRQEVGRWADSSRSSHLGRIRRSLQAISQEVEHSRDWRPVMLVFSENQQRRQRILRFASWIEGNSGFTTAVHIVRGTGAVGNKQRDEAELQLRKDIAQLPKCHAFPLAVVAPTMPSAIGMLVQSAGLGPVRANTVVFNWFDRESGARKVISPAFFSNLRTVLRQGCSIVIFECTTEELAAFDSTPVEERTIHVWFSGDASGRMMLLFAYLMTRHSTWKGARIQLLAWNEEPERSDSEALEELHLMLEEVRIDAEPEIVSPASAAELVRRSRDASLVLCPVRLSNGDILGPFAAALETEILLDLPMTALMLAAQDIELDAEPEAGLFGAIAEAMDVAADLKNTTEKASRETEAAEVEYSKAQAALEEAQRGEADPDRVKEVEKQLKTAETAAEKSRRRVAKLQAKWQSAIQEMNMLMDSNPGVVPPVEEASPNPAEGSASK